MSICEVTQQLVYDTIHSALRVLFSEDLPLLQDDANERSISHRLAIYVETEVETRDGWEAGLHVDCEYNRNEENPTYPYSKKLRLPERNDISNEDTRATTVFPDIIVHRRRSTVNCLVIEIKKQGGDTAAEDFDRAGKIPAYLMELGYRFGVFLVLGVGNAAGTICEFSILEQTETGITLTKCA
jgi:hypothetical protein